MSSGVRLLPENVLQSVLTKLALHHGVCKVLVSDHWEPSDTGEAAWSILGPEQPSLGEMLGSR